MPELHTAESEAVGRLSVPATTIIEKGVLYVVSTPIGNLQDITIRALEVLRGVDLIAAEDTRHSAKLLRHFGIEAKMTSFHDFNKEKQTPYLIGKLKAGQAVGLISDAGTPGISDPGFYLIREAIMQNIPLQAIPGPTAFVPALVLSGLPTNNFVFEGFPPSRKKRRTFFSDLKDEHRTIVLYESPHRIIRTLQDIAEHWGERRMALVRELTKKFEHVIRGTTSDLLAAFADDPPRGEIVLVVEGKQRRRTATTAYQQPCEGKKR